MRRINFLFYFLFLFFTVFFHYFFSSIESAVVLRSNQFYGQLNRMRAKFYVDSGARMTFISKADARRFCDDDEVAEGETCYGFVRALGKRVALTMNIRDYEDDDDATLGRDWIAAVGPVTFDYAGTGQKGLVFKSRYVTGKFAGHPMGFEVDTGATKTWFVNYKRAFEICDRIEPSAEKTEMFVKGPKDVYGWCTGTVELFGKQFPNIRTKVIDFPDDDSDMLLGLDVLRGIAPFTFDLPGEDNVDSVTEDDDYTGRDEFVNIPGQQNPPHQRYPHWGYPGHRWPHHQRGQNRQNNQNRNNQRQRQGKKRGKTEMPKKQKQKGKEKEKAPKKKKAASKKQDKNAESSSSTTMDFVFYLKIFAVLFFLKVFLNK